MDKYFFDTYALVEIIKNNPNYVKFINEVIATSILNLMELYYALLRDLGEVKAKLAYYQFKDSVSEINDETIFGAMNLKLKNRNLSYTDCIGYTFSLRHNLKFLTGDKEFKEMENVEFVK